MPRGAIIKQIISQCHIYRVRARRQARLDLAAGRVVVSHFSVVCIEFAFGVDSGPLILAFLGLSRPSLILPVCLDRPLIHTQTLVTRYSETLKFFWGSFKCPDETEYIELEEGAIFDLDYQH